MTDLHYISDGFYITLLPNTVDGVYLYNATAKEFDGHAKFPAHMLPFIKGQITDAGYTIRKAPKRSANWLDKIDVEALLKELED